MAEKPILFNDEMIRAILDGRKTQTRRPIRTSGFYVETQRSIKLNYTLRYTVGDVLWVRETWKPTRCGFDDSVSYVRYRADDTRLEIRHDIQGCMTDHWRPSVHMPRWASRITLEVTDVVIQRIQEISTAECLAEGSVPPCCKSFGTIGGGWTVHVLFREMWDSIYAKRGFGWDENPWVEAVTFAVREVRG